MKKIIIIALLNILSLSVFSGCASAIRIDGPYRGRVIDADTREAIEGVAVLGIWYSETPTVAGAVNTYYDATETVTAENGEFEIKGLGVLVMSNVIPMNVLIFKAGYEYWGLGPWSGLKKGYRSSETVKWEGDKAIISLKKLTMEERKKQKSPDFPSEIIAKKRMSRMLEEINKDRLEKGLDTY